MSVVDGYAPPYWPVGAARLVQHRVDNANELYRVGEGGKAKFGKGGCLSGRDTEVCAEHTLNDT